MVIKLRSSSNCLKTLVNLFDDSVGLEDGVDVLDDAISHEIQLFELFLDFSLYKLQIFKDLIMALAEVFDE